MTCPFSNELLYEIASHLDFLDIIRDPRVTSSAPLQELHRTILHACLASKRFYQIFHPMIKRVVFDDGTMQRRTSLIKKYLEHPEKARGIRALSCIPSTMSSDNLHLGLDTYPPYYAHMQRYHLPQRIKALGTLLTLLPDLEALQVAVQGYFTVEHMGLLQLFELVKSDHRLSPKLKTVTICHINRNQHGFNPTGVQHILALPSIEELHVKDSFIETNALGSPMPLSLAARFSNLKVLRLFSCDLHPTRLEQLVRSIRRLEEIMLQWATEPRATSGFDTNSLMAILRLHTTSFRRIDLDGSLSRHIMEPLRHIMPIGSFRAFTSLERLSIPMALLTGKMQAAVARPWTSRFDGRNDTQYLEGLLKDCIEWASGKATPQIDWGFLTDVFPISLKTLKLQSSAHSVDAQVAAKWLQRFVTKELDTLPLLRCLDLSSWDREALKLVFELLDQETTRQEFDRRKKAILLPVKPSNGTSRGLSGTWTSGHAQLGDREYASSAPDNELAHLFF